MPTLGEKICSREDGAESEFLDRFELRVFCLCMARLADRQASLRWTANLLEECLRKLRHQCPLDDHELALFVANHARERILAAPYTGLPGQSVLRAFDASSFFRGPAFHRALLDEMQTMDKRILYRWLSQRMSTAEIAAELKLAPGAVLGLAVEAIERALPLMRKSREKATTGVPTADASAEEASDAEAS